MEIIKKYLCCPKCLEDEKLVTVKGVDGGIKCPVHGFVSTGTYPKKGSIIKLKPPHIDKSFYDLMHTNS